MFTDAPSFVCLYWAVTCLSPSNNICLKYLIVSTYRHKVSRFFSLNMCYYDKVPNRNQNPKKIKIGLFFCTCKAKNHPQRRTKICEYPQQLVWLESLYCGLLLSVAGRCRSMHCGWTEY